jgi:predicted Zn finger-like uncharacterized protein
MLVVIRCPKCRGASRVEEADLGQTVQCPRCADTFSAIEEAELIAPGPKSIPGVESANGVPPPAAPPRRITRAQPSDEPPPPEPPAAEKPAPEPELDAYGEPPGSLPASVLIGLALLPFLIPILWLIAPAVIGQEPVLSLASALALAFSTSVLCLAVIYTVDWRPTTRIRGVLLLVVLSYVAGITLYFMKKEWVDGVRKFFGVQLPWVEFEPKGGGYRVKMPTQPVEVRMQPLGIVSIACHQARSDRFGRATFVVGSSHPLPKDKQKEPRPGTDAWFKAATDDLAKQAQAAAVKSEPAEYEGKVLGRQIDLTLANGQMTRIVRLFVIKDRVYYLAVEGPGVRADDEEVGRFFDSFEVPDAAK